MRSLFFLLLFVNYVVSVKQGNVISLTDERYDIILKISGKFSKPSSERNNVVNSVIRKYYRWIKDGKEITVGPSGKTIYVDGKQLIRKEELNREISHAAKESKNGGTRKLKQRIKTRFLGCSERNLIKAKADSKSLR